MELTMQINERFNWKANPQNENIIPADEWKTVYHTIYRYYEYRIIPFRLANTSATFNNII
jgi:hypothetical protein